MTDKVADDDYDDDEVIPWIASSKSSDQKWSLYHNLSSPDQKVEKI